MTTVARECVCRSLSAVRVCERERDREKVGQGERGGQPQLSASANVLTAHLYISMCHELFVSPNMCVCLCELKGLGKRRG